VAVALLPDVVTLVRAYLAGCTDVTAIVGERIATSSPKDNTKPWLRLSRIGGPASSTAPMRLDKPIVQVDSFAPATGTGNQVFGDAGAMLLARTARACLLVAAGFADSEGLIAYVLETQGPTNQPDTSRTPPTPRVHFTVTITTRPA
jgi:hypothetical protein